MATKETHTLRKARAKTCHHLLSHVYFGVLSLGQREFSPVSRITVELFLSYFRVNFPDIDSPSFYCINALSKNRSLSLFLF